MQQFSKAWKDYRVLVVDDDPAVLQVLRKFLTEGGFQVLTAESGEAGLQLLETQSAQVIISDQMMGLGISGTEFLRRVKERDPDCVTMIFSAYSDANHVLEAMNEAGAFQYLSKPGSKREILEKTHQAMDLYHLQADRRRLATANERLLRKVAIEHNFSLLGNFSKDLCRLFKPLIQDFDLLAQAKRAELGPNDELHGTFIFAQERWAQLTAVLGRMDRLGEFFAQPEAPRNTNLRVLLEESLHKATQDALQEAATLQTEIRADTALRTLSVQPTLLRFALNALYENSVIFARLYDGRNSMKVLIELSEHEDPDPLQKDSPNTLVRIDYHDNGPGIKPEYHDKAFLPLFSKFPLEGARETPQKELESPNFGIYHHVGLGLSIAQWCINQHGGSLILLKDPSPLLGGCHFRIELPRSALIPIPVLQADSAIN